MATSVTNVTNMTDFTNYTSRALLFSTKEDLKMIQEVKKHKCLYDKADKDHRSTKAKDVVWKHISSVVQRDVKTCKKRWLNMKDQYIKIKKKLGPRQKHSWRLFRHLRFLDVCVPPLLSSQQDENPKILTVVQQDTDEADTDDQEIDDETDNTLDTDSTSNFQYDLANASAHQIHISSSSTNENKLEKSMTAIEEKIIRLEERLKAFTDTHMSNTTSATTPDEDDIDVFFKSISLTIKKLPRLLIFAAKLKILQLIGELECGYLTELRQGKITSEELLGNIIATENTNVGDLTAKGTVIAKEVVTAKGDAIAKEVVTAKGDATS